MSFSLTKAPAVFQALVNDILQDMSKAYHVQSVLTF